MRPNWLEGRFTSLDCSQELVVGFLWAMVAARLADEYMVATRPIRMGSLRGRHLCPNALRRRRTNGPITACKWTTSCEPNPVLVLVVGVNRCWRHFTVAAFRRCPKFVGLFPSYGDGLQCSTSGVIPRRVSFVRTCERYNSPKRWMEMSAP